MVIVDLAAAFTRNTVPSPVRDPRTYRLIPPGEAAGRFQFAARAWPCVSAHAPTGIASRQGIRNERFRPAAVCADKPKKGDQHFILAGGRWRKPRSAVIWCWNRLKRRPGAGQRGKGLSGRRSGHCRRRQQRCTEGQPIPDPTAELGPMGFSPVTAKSASRSTLLGTGTSSSAYSRHYRLL